MNVQMCVLAAQCKKPSNYLKENKMSILSIIIPRRMVSKNCEILDKARETLVNLRHLQIEQYFVINEPFYLWRGTLYVM